MLWKHKLPDVVVSLFAVLLLARYAATKPTNQLQNSSIVNHVIYQLHNGETIKTIDDSSQVIVTTEDIERGYRLASVTTNLTVSYSCPANGDVWESWTRRGAFCDWFTLEFPSGWEFTLCSNNLNRVTVFSDTKIRPNLRAVSDEISALPSSASAVPSVSEFWHATSTNDSQLFTWRNFRYDRGSGDAVNAQIELFRNGDFVVRSNTVERTFSRIVPFDFDGDGLSNDIDAQPYVYNGDHRGQTAQKRERILGEVGIGLENGWYYLSAIFPERPRCPTLVSVGTNRMVVVEAGEYLFLLEKGIEYDICVEPKRDDVIYGAYDDVFTAQISQNPLIRSIEWWGPGYGGDITHGFNGEWTQAFGFLELSSPSSWGDGYVAWWPGFKGSPDLDDLDPNKNCVFTGVFTDCHVNLQAQYKWESLFNVLSIVSPNARTTEVLALPEELESSVLSVSATYGGIEHTSYIGGRDNQNTNSVKSGYYVGADSVVFRGGERRPLVVSSHTDDPDIIPLPTNGMLTLSFKSGSSNVRLWSAKDGGVEVSLPLTWPVNEFDGFTCYIEGVSVSDSKDDISFHLEYTGYAGNKEQIAKVTCVEVKCIHVTSSVAGDSSNPPPFDGQTNYEFNVRHSPNPDKHLPIFFESVKDNDFNVKDFSVRLKVELMPSDIATSMRFAKWEFLEPSPRSGSLVPLNATEADFVNPKVGGVYHIGVTYYGSPMSECNIVLPLAGAEIADLLAANIVQASNFVQKAIAKYSGRRCNSPRFGWKWFVKEGNGDYLGRPDNSLSPTVWCYNQVSDTGMGAVATLAGIPIRIAKLSNFIVGYASSLLDIGSKRSFLAQLIGTSNDQSSVMSWQAGEDVAKGSNFWLTVSNLSHKAWGASDRKNMRLWPNENNLDNAGNPIYYTNFNRVFYPPGFTRKDP